MAIATCVFTCKSWFCMSRMTCLIIFSGCSARSIRSLRLARTKVDTRSSNAIGDSFHDHVRTAAPLQFTQGRLSAVRPNEARRLTADSSRTEVHSERQFRKKISCGAAKSRALSKQFSVEAWLKPCPPDLASLLHGRDARAYIANRAPAPHTPTSLLPHLCSKAAKHPGPSGPCHQSF